MYPRDLKYTKDHEWINIKNETGKIGITEYAQQQLGDVVFVELPKIGQAIKRGEQFGSIESAKAVSDLYSPVSGEVLNVNEALIENPELVNKSPHETWIISIKLTELDEVKDLFDSINYEALLK